MDLIPPYYYRERDVKELAQSLIREGKYVDIDPARYKYLVLYHYGGHYLADDRIVGPKRDAPNRDIVFYGRSNTEPVSAISTKPRQAYWRGLMLGKGELYITTDQWLTTERYWNLKPNSPGRTASILLVVLLIIVLLVWLILWCRSKWSGLRW